MRCVRLFIIGFSIAAGQNGLAADGYVTADELRNQVYSHIVCKAEEHSAVTKRQAVLEISNIQGVNDEGSSDLARVHGRLTIRDGNGTILPDRKMDLSVHGGTKCQEGLPAYPCGAVLDYYASPSNLEPFVGLSLGAADVLSKIPYILRESFTGNLTLTFTHSSLYYDLSCEIN